MTSLTELRPLQLLSPKSQFDLWPPSEPKTHCQSTRPSFRGTTWDYPRNGVGGGERCLLRGNSVVSELRVGSQLVTTCNLQADMQPVPVCLLSLLFMQEFAADLSSQMARTRGNDAMGLPLSSKDLKFLDNEQLLQLHQLHQEATKPPATSEK